MNITYKNSYLNFKIVKTNSSIGLQNDFWCWVNFELCNSELNYKNAREVITVNELKDKTELIKNFYYQLEVNNQNISFIKNFFTIDLKMHKNDKFLILKLNAIGNDFAFRDYSIELKNEEIIKFVKLIEKSGIK